jgi:hypothetical protein
MPDTIPAGNTDHVGTMLVVRELNGRRTVVIPRDVTALEAACFAAFIMEFNERHVFRGWRLEERLEHFGLTRFLVEGGSVE